MTIEQLRAIVALIKAQIDAVVGTAQGVQGLITDVTTIISPESPAAPGLNIDLFVANYLPLFEEKMMALAYAAQNMNVAGYNPFVIVVTHTEGGVAVPFGNVFVLPNRNKTITFTPDPGYMVSDVLIDGVSVGHPNSYEFQRVTENHTVHVVFVQG